MAKSKLVKANDKIAEHVVSGYKKIEDGVVNGYQKVEPKGHDFIPGSRERRLPCLWYRHVLRADLAGKVFPEGLLIGICSISGIAGAWPLYFWITKTEIIDNCVKSVHAVSSSTTKI